MNLRSQSVRSPRRRAASAAVAVALMAVVLGAAGRTDAAAINWSVGDVDGGSGLGDAAVSTSGSLVEAANFGDADAVNVTVNTVLFTAANFTGPYPLTRLTGLTFNAGLEGFGSSSGDTAIDTLTHTLAFRSGSVTQNTTLTGLTIGQRYEVQLFQSLNHQDRTVTVNDGLGNTAVAKTRAPDQFVTGTFIADAGTQTLTVTDNTSGSLVLSGYQLRETYARLSVDFGVSDASPGPGGSANDLQAGFVALNTPHTSGSGPQDFGNASSGSGTFSGIGVAVAGDGQWRDRGASVTGAAALGMGDLLEEFVYGVNTLSLTLTGLVDGMTYQLTTFHHDTTGSRDSSWIIDVDGDTLADFIHGSVDGTSGTTPALSQGIGMLTSTFVAGADPVVITGTVDSSIVVLNGFTILAIPAIEAIPTPGALPAGLAMLGLIAARRRHA